MPGAGVGTMADLERVWILMGLAALASGAGSALADVPESAPGCEGESTLRAHWLADQARREGNYQRAAECYLAAGEPNEADRAFAKASVEASATTSRKLAANLEDAKSQARRLRQAFRAR